MSTFVLVAVAVGLVTALYAAAGGDVDPMPPGLNLVGTLVQDIAFVVCALVFAALRVRPRAWHFGLRRAPLWPTAGWTLVAAGSFYALIAAYTALVQPDGGQTIVEDLGADRGGALLVASVILVVGVAPAVEEFFFRGFFYGALRTRLGVLAAAGANGVLFGAIHYTGAETLAVLPPLALIGFAFCLLYERTGTLFAPIAFHALNNAIAFSAQVDADGRTLAIGVGALTIAGCIVVGARQRPDAPTPFGSRGWVGA